jgi:hypothetical protein
MKKIISLAIVCVMMLGMLSMVSFAAPAAIGESTTTWEITGTTLTIAGTGEMPAGVKPWSDSIATITKVVVKSGVTVVSSQAFNYAEALSEIVIEEGVTELKGDAFAHCGEVAKVTLPASLTTLGQGVFYNTTITEVDYAKTYAEFKSNVTVGAYNTALDTADWGEEAPTSGDLSATLKWEIKDGVLKITGTGDMPNGQPWVQSIPTITAVEISEGVTSIGSQAFTNFKVEKIVIPEGVTKIGADAFSYNDNLKEITIPSTLTEMGQGTVWSCGGIEVVNYYGESKDAFKAIASQKDYNGAYTAEGVTFNVLELDNNDTPVDPDTPDTPVEPPKNGDATVFAVVFAAVAVLGMAVVVTKKVHA